ncbi:MarC family integral membrane protein [Candidatus Norongarragalina meridionalis]|nr:MarC family integral membrane protein [Candidatus Norongarragalina meridionalis]
MFEQFLTAFAVLFVIMNPLSSVMPFLTLTKDFSEAQRRHAADKAALVAGGLALAFLFIGEPLLDVMGLKISAFRIAGGVILSILGIQTSLGISLTKVEASDEDAIAVLIGTPMLTGPGVITAIILQAADTPLLPLFFAILGVVIASWLVIRYSSYLTKALGQRLIGVVAKIMGLLLLTRGIQNIMLGLGDF